MRVPKRGTPVTVHWEDVLEEPVGDPKEATTEMRRSLGYIVGLKKRKGRKFLVTTTTLDKGKISETSGWCAYPWGVVRRIVKM